MTTILTVVLLIIGIILCAVVLLQSKRAAGLGAITSSSAGSSDSYWSKNKGNSMEGSLARITKILGAAFMIIALVLSFL